MMKLVSIFGMASLIVAVPSDLSAAASSGSRQQLHKWMGCVASKYGDTARAVTLGDGDALEELLVSGQMFDQACIPGGNVRYNGVAFLDPIAEFVLRRDFKKTDRIDFAASEAIVSRQISVELDRAKADNQSQTLDTLRRQQMGLCILQRDEVAATNLLVTRVDSKAEAQAASAMAPTIEQCLPKEYSAALTNDEIRGAIATIRYRLLHIARTGGENA